MPRPSDPVIGWLRDLVKKRGRSTAEIARATGIPRARLRRVLVGEEPMTLDEFQQVATALEISPQEIGGPSPEALELPEKAAEGEDVPRVDPFGNQPAQLFRVGFDLGCTFMFLGEVALLDGSGVPAPVLEQYRGRGQIPIRLDADYHAYHNPRYDEEGVTLTLSFDALYECRFPWHTIRQVIFWPVPPTPTREEGDEDEPPERPVLRLVE